jgi:ubiquinone/menaquinone biosynthesis C-methylase UbiE
MLAAAWGKPGTQRGRHWETLIAIRNLVRGKSILDIACGQGHFFAVLPDPKPEYLGIDNSVDMLEKAREFFPEYSPLFIEGDAYNLPYELKKYDSVIVVDLLMHLPTIDEPIKQAWGKTGMELIIAHQIAGRHTLTRKVYSSKIVLPKEKILLNRYDTLEQMYMEFSKLPDVHSIEQFFYDSRMQIFRLTRGIPRFNSRKGGWPK